MIKTINKANMYYSFFNNNCAIFVSNILEDRHLKNKTNILTLSGLESFIKNDINFKKYIKGSYTAKNVMDFNLKGKPKINYGLAK